MSEKIKYEITGNTFGRKQKIKKAGGVWNPGKKSWTAELYKTDSIFRYNDLIFTEIKTSNKNGVCPKCHTYCYGDCQA